MTEIRDTSQIQRNILQVNSAEARDARDAGGPKTGLGGRGTDQGLHSGLSQHRGGRGTTETQAAMRVELFQASLGRASVPGVGAEPVIGDKPQGEDTRERPRSEQQDLVVIPRGELASFAAQRTAEAPAPARASQIEAVVERIMNEISAGQRVGIQRGAGGALTVSFPMGQTALGISAIALTMTPDTLTVALSITGKGPEDSALRDLAQSLATRHPTKTVRIVREADEQGRSGGNA